MVLKFGTEPDDIFFIEATGNQGVSIKRYSGMKHTIGSFYKKIVLRHLEWERPDSALDVLEQFIEEAQQCSYDLSFNKLRKRATINLDKQARQRLVEEQKSASASSVADETANKEKVRLIEEGRGFICSELVMKAYKCVGLIQSDEACSNWLPGDMTQAKNKMNLCTGASLGPEELFLTETMYRKE